MSFNDSTISFSSSEQESSKGEDGTVSGGDSTTNDGKIEKLQCFIQKIKFLFIFFSASSNETSGIEENTKSSNQSNPSLVDIPETESENESVEKITVLPRKSKFNRIIDPDSDSSDEEETQRKSLYQTESDIEDHQLPIEDQAYSKATRRSIHGFQPNESNAESSDDSETSDSLIIEDSGDEEEEKKDVDKENDGNSTLEYTPLSSTMRSPLKEVSNNNNRSSLTVESFNNSIASKMSSTTSYSEKEASKLLDEAAGGSFTEKTKVSPSEYEATVAEKNNFENQMNALLKALEMTKNLPDGGQKLRQRINILCDKIEKKTKLLETMEVDENKSIKKEIVRSFQSNFEDKSIINVEEYVNRPVQVKPTVFKPFRVDDVKPQFTGTVGMMKFTTAKALTVEKLTEFQQEIEDRPAETVFAEQPKYLKVTLMPHQLHALAFMTWREEQNPRGGFLADDMGLGKTLTAISLILKSIQADEEQEDESSDDEDDIDEEWKARGRKDLRPGGKWQVVN